MASIPPGSRNPLFGFLVRVTNIKIGSASRQLPEQMITALLHGTTERLQDSQQRTRRISDYVIPHRLHEYEAISNKTLYYTGWRACCLGLPHSWTGGARHPLQCWRIHFEAVAKYRRNFRKNDREGRRAYQMECLEAIKFELAKYDHTPHERFLKDAWIDWILEHSHFQTARRPQSDQVMAFKAMLARHVEGRHTLGPMHMGHASRQPFGSWRESGEGLQRVSNLESFRTVSGRSRP